jgi:hypothetical protein
MQAQGLLPERVYAQIMKIDPHRMDRFLPAWARRANPIIRAQLGVFWRAMTPDLSVPARWYLYQMLITLVSFALPGMFNLLLPVVVVPVILLPFVLYFYCDTLFRIGAETAMVLADDVRQDRITLLRTTPIPLMQALAAKGAAAIWRQVETLELLLLAIVLLSFPMVILQHATFNLLDAQPMQTRLMVITGVTASIGRFFLEPMMIAALGIAMGSVNKLRIPAILSTGALAFAYAVLINLPRLLELDVWGRLLIETALPLALPVAITWLSLKFAVHQLTRD